MSSSKQGSLVNAQDVFEVSRILQRGKCNGQTYYLVQWKGFPEEQATWEPISNLQNCKKAIEQFEILIAKLQKEKSIENEQKSFKDSKNQQKKPQSEIKSKRTTSNNPHSKRSLRRSNKIPDQPKDIIKEVKKDTVSSEKAQKNKEKINLTREIDENQSQQLTTAQTAPQKNKEKQIQKQVPKKQSSPLQIKQNQILRQSHKKNVNSKIKKQLIEQKTILKRDQVSLNSYNLINEQISQNQNIRKKVKKNQQIQEIIIQNIQKVEKNLQQKAKEKLNNFQAKQTKILINSNDNSIGPQIQKISQKLIKSGKNEQINNRFNTQNRYKRCQQYLNQYKQQLLFHLTEKILHSVEEPILTNKFLEFDNQDQILKNRKILKILTIEEINQLEENGKFQNLIISLLIKTKQNNWYSLLQNENEKKNLIAKIQNLPQFFWKINFRKFISSN